MDKRWLINLLNQTSEEITKIYAIAGLGTHVEDSEVLDALCREAIETSSRRVREALIDTLKGNPDEANRRFSQIACRATDPTRRRWALINLSLMECGDAKKAVMQGLRDSHQSVRIAAAFNAGLYCDGDVVNALGLFFERNRHFLVLDGVCQAVRPLVPLLKKLCRLYSEYYRHDEAINRREGCA